MISAYVHGPCADRVTMGIIRRTVRFEYSDSFNASWHKRLPEFASAANAVSLLMPYAEPYIARSVRDQLDPLDPDLRSEASLYVAQELQHQAQHGRFNAALVRQHPVLSRVERAAAATFSFLERRGSTGFHLAFAAGFETLAYTSARWVDRQLGALFSGSDDTAATLFLWHLAEEVEHKSVAHDVFNARCGSRITLLAGTMAATAVVALFTVLTTWLLLMNQGLMISLRAHARLTKWSVGFAFDLLPALFVSLLPSHHPSDLVDPPWFAQWLATYDAESRSIPVWHSPVSPTVNGATNRADCSPQTSQGLPAELVAQ